jgi:hypothetical protein
LRQFARAYEREPHDRCIAAHADGLERDAGVLADLEAAQIAQPRPERAALLAPALELDPLVEVLGVLPHDHEVDAVVAGGHPRERAGGTDGREQIEVLTERDVHATEPGADRRRDGALQRDPAVADRVQRALRQEGPVILEGGRAGGPLDPFEVDAGRVQHVARRGRHLRADPVPGHHHDPVRHRSRP